MGIGGLFALLCLVGTTAAWAQEGFEVIGVVLSADDSTPLPGVNIIETGTTNGTSTNAQGQFALTVSGPDASLTFSYIGFAQQTIPLDGHSELTVEMEPQAAELEGVVVTALGIKRQQRSLGYATSEVDTEELVKVPQADVANLLQGKVPGLVVNPNAGGLDASSTVTIRGVSSIAGDNDPLYVVDGIPIDNSTIGSAGRFGGFDGGSALNIINPNSIASITVLKGAAAAALYGSRARDGVIIINTKTGRGVTGGGFNVNFSSTLTAQNVVTGFTDYQRQYGQGSRGLAPSTQAEARGAGLSSWGARLSEVEEAAQFDGVTRPYAAVSTDRRSAFYQTALSTSNSISFNGGYESTSFRLSASHATAESIIPSSGYQQTSVTLRGQSEFGDLTAGAQITYLNELANDRTYLGDFPRNPNFLTSFLPANVPLNALQPGYTADSTELQFSNNVFLTNPYWVTKRLDVDDDRDRILGGVNLNYEILDWLSVQARTGLDWYTLRRTQVIPYGTAYQPDGSMREDEYRVWESNTKMIVTATPQFTEDFSMRLDVGGNLLKRESEQVALTGSDFTIPFFATISNMENQTTVYNFSEKQINSLFGAAVFNYNNYLFLRLTGRNDWSSTLPEQNNSYFYPSVSGSFVFTDAFSMPDWFSYGKLRAAWAKIGGDTSPYRLFLTYALIGNHQGQPLLSIAQEAVPLFNLKPTSTTEVELGFETSFFNDRIGIDFTWYRRSTVDQILNITVSGTSGYSSRLANSGELQNSGVELLLTTTPVVTETFNWDATVNFAANNSEVVALAEGLDIRYGPLNRIGSANIVQIPGQPVNAIYGSTFVRDENGNIVHDEDGLPIVGDDAVLGKAAPDWALGFANTFTYKNLSLNILLDVKWGGQIFSGTNAYAYLYGLHKNTLEGRAACDQQIGPEGYPEDGCMVGDGMIVTERDPDTDDITGIAPNDEAVLPSEYYGRIAGIAEAFVYDANYVNLRQVRLSYSLPQRWLAQTPFQRATLSLIGRNLFYLYETVPNVDPASAYNSADSPGFEMASVPTTRSFGFSLDVTL